MSVQRHDMIGELGLYRRSTFAFEAQWQTDAEEPINIAAYTPKFTVHTDAGTLVFAAQAEWLTKPSTGTVRLDVPASASSTWPIGVHRYDLIVETNTLRIPLLRGMFEIIREVTP